MNTRSLFSCLLALAALAACTSPPDLPPGGCLFDADCESPLRCVAQACRAPCRTDADCLPSQVCTGGDVSGVRICTARKGERSCVYSTECPEGQVCTRDGVCRAQCQNNYDCQVINPFLTCSASRACELVCGSGTANCDADVRNGCETVLATDARHCGMCGNACVASGMASAACVAGRCVNSCAAGFADCDMSAANGCEADLSNAMNCGACGRRCEAGQTCTRQGDGYMCANAPCPPERATSCGGTCVDVSADPMNCGACGTVCPSGANGQGRCVGGRCDVACTEPTRQGNCDGNAANGCEAELLRDPMNCRDCGVRCPGGANATAACNEGACGLTCNAGFGNCDGAAMNGCEAGLATDPTSCGMCGNACPVPPNSRATCAAGRCGSECLPNFADCDMNAANGCETDTRASGAHCGRCGNACTGGLVCAMGACVSNCPAGQTLCSGACVNVSTSTAHCGGCGRACAVPANGTATCAMGACGIACNTGFGNCDGNAANGCETALTSSATSCGACGTTCVVANATPACSAGRCVIGACNAGFADCDGNAANGCEVDTRTTATSCGMCGRACNLPNATAACAGGMCAVAACNTGFADCDRNAANGCETDVRTSATNCGVCGNVCRAQNATATCMVGRCTTVCNAGFGDCNMNPADGCEVSLATTPAHCGMCGRACSLANATSGCAASMCTVASCNAGFGNCDMNAANGCEVNLGASAAHCGMCGRTCSLANATAACSAGACTIASCNAGFADCDGNPANGCETDTRTTVTSCGMCGRACSLANATAACAAGACTIASCNAGFGNCDMSAANGCEVDTRTSTAHCGACGRACAAGQVCSGATPTCTTVCTAPTTMCSGRCVLVASDVSNCGRCGNVCPAPANGAATCAMGACGIACSAGFGNCDGNAANGCETNVTTTLAHCGGCGMACAPANATGVCAAGRCGVGTCNAGFGNCDGNAANGCETNLNTSAASCGACGNACSFANATPACTGGRCTIGACNAGFADCDMNPSNGCETNTSSTVAHCGGCGMACAALNGTPSCGGGACSIVCGAGFGDCDGNARNGCETNLGASTAHCGACGRACSFANGVPGCRAGTCALAGCNTGFGDCNGASADGCEVNLATDSRNCGACANSCAVISDRLGALHSCQASVCRPVNDRCAGAEVINLAAGARISLSANTSTALHDIDPPCRATTSPDVYFTFTLTQRELVYANTFGATWDTVLFFASSCTAGLTASTTPGDAVCNDDASGAGCASAGTTSVVMAALNPGTYYLVLSGYNGASGRATLNFEHYAIGNSPLIQYNTAVTNQTLRGTVSGTSGVTGSCAGAGPEVHYWWRSCPGDGGGRFRATTCDANTSYDTVLYMRHGDSTADACNDDNAGCTGFARTSQIVSFVPSNWGLHVLTVDTYSGAGGSYVLYTFFPEIIITDRRAPAPAPAPKDPLRLDPRRGVCLPPPRVVRG